MKKICIQLFSLINHTCCFLEYKHLYVCSSIHIHIHPFHIKTFGQVQLGRVCTHARADTHMQPHIQHRDVHIQMQAQEAIKLSILNIFRGALN